MKKRYLKPEAEQIDVLVSIHSIVMITYGDVLLLVEIEMISQFDTCIEVTQFLSIGACSR